MASFSRVYNELAYCYCNVIITRIYIIRYMELNITRDSIQRQLPNIFSSSVARDASEAVCDFKAAVVMWISNRTSDKTVHVDPTKNSNKTKYELY